MQVERDELWYDLFKSFASFSDLDDRTRQTNACWKAKVLYQLLDKQQMKVKVIEKVTALQKPKTSVIRRCQARNLNGKECTFKATCGNFCKKHKITDKNIVLDAKSPAELCQLVEE